MARIITISSTERAELFRDDGATQPGGFQNLLRKIQSQTKEAGYPGFYEVELRTEDLERIPRYAFDYRGGGWQQRLMAIFGRTLGPDLGRGSAPQPSAPPSLGL